MVEIKKHWLTSCKLVLIVMAQVNLAGTLAPAEALVDKLQTCLNCYGTSDPYRNTCASRGILAGTLAPAEGD